MVANAPFGGTAIQIVMHAVALENLNYAIVHTNRHSNFKSSLRVPQHCMRVGIEFDLRRDLIQLLPRLLPHVMPAHDGCDGRFGDMNVRDAIDGRRRGVLQFQ